MSSVINLDKIVFGNPSGRDKHIMETGTYLDSIMDDVLIFAPPKNSSPATVAELEMIKRKLSSRSKDSDILFDNELLSYIKNVFIKGGADKGFVDTVCNAIAEDVVPLVTRMKYYFNRPRPYQLAYYHGVELFPEFSYFTNTPSYPSGHTCLTFVTLGVLGNLYPEQYKKVSSLVEQVSESRVAIGAHYPSDNNTAIILGQKILSNPEFKSNYRL